ncbi:acetylserotonin O-methyltransferase [Tupaia chinensis]|uniref:Acetylserotonin O-methyltransferase n=1 Tax=Tupaia chinensis TaxID=246437 RepID=L8YC89_TUPCH|nr:acetylserotonin O-methyltransferase [Tupaia chinensis]ELV12575.1 Hydroxyindole O-methyltransferase [Tupaia chinensis]
MSQCHMLQYLARSTYPCWGHLAEAVRSAPERLQFTRGLQEVWSVHGRSVLTAFDLSPFPVVCDLGGSSGALAKECTALYPECTVTVFDIPEVVQMVKEHFSFPEEGRIHFHEGDFFKDRLPEANLFILARILHDWSDEKCSHLLQRVYHSCTPGGGILVVESLLDEDRRGPLTTLLYSLNMLVQTEGQERTASEYCSLISSAGFVDFQFKKTGHTYDAILARK